ncbi:hypothetical protein PTNB85_05194 [Pyrenophora teres f. teres]|nr:hypothetical protein HRS9139_04270 [Pyrenophora teres f. teres]KAE8837859.1 hypothetical protein PTNB85_05194 [Pyrenophora teres f. teres]KAE8839722.1 hypothetical protein HRS9122_06327 [Pyrenophora teres f. teres]KAE8862682.1 hypothetical protein PTNB29_05244 [Pyrenophora teres f. teres]CAE6997848.1 hypothetical protein PTTW11_00606 [Pyrenophora teres f. teres]
MPPFFSDYSRLEVRPASLLLPSRGSRARATCRRSWIGRCRMFTVDTLTFHSPPTPPVDFTPSSPSFTVHYSRQSMSRGGKLAPEVNRALFVKNLSFNVTPAELFDLFGKFGPVRQIRQGIANNTKGTAFVVYEDVMDAKSACDKLNGFNFQNRYLVVLYHQPDKMLKAASDLAERQENLEKLKKQHGID